MIEVQGKYTKGKIFTDNVEEKAYAQTIEACNQPWIIHPRWMPDIHYGEGCTIGTTYYVEGIGNADHVGVDIGCNMYVVRLKNRGMDLKILEQVIKTNVPMGFSNNLTKTDAEFVYDLKCADAPKIDINKGLYALGSMGGGNHFIEGNEDSEGNLYLVAHSGSRGLGFQVANHYSRLGAFNDYQAKRDAIIEKAKLSNEEQLIPERLEELKNNRNTMPNISGEVFENYIHDMKIMQKFALLNTELILWKIIDAMELSVDSYFHTVHNYIDTENMIVRKGAVSAQDGEMLVIPMNMGYGTLLCRGKGNADWNFSAPHGAGRTMSRGKARGTLSMEKFKSSMEFIYSPSVSKGTLDESPDAYKPPQEIIDNIHDTVDIVDVLKPFFNIKDTGKHEKRSKQHYQSLKESMYGIQ